MTLDAPAPARDLHLKNPRNGGAADAMSHILECALNTRVAPRWIFYNNQATYFRAHTVSAGVLLRVRPLAHNELPMPSQDRVRRDDARDLIQEWPAQPMPTDGQPASIVIGERKSLATEMASKDSIFFDQIRAGANLTPQWRGPTGYQYFSTASRLRRR